MTKVLLFAACLGPLAHLGWRAWSHTLGANQVQTIQFTTGDWTIYFLLLTLAITPLRRLSGRSELLRYRRMLGLFAFFYACLHFTTWAVLDKSLDPSEMLKDFVKRRFITAGIVSLACMLLLAITSTNGWIRRLGKNWGRLHTLIYVAAIAGVVHYYWLVKRDHFWPLVDAAALSVLLGYRLAANLASRRTAS